MCAASVRTDVLTPDESVPVKPFSNPALSQHTNTHFSTGVNSGVGGGSRATHSPIHCNWTGGTPNQQFTFITSTKYPTKKNIERLPGI